MAEKTKELGILATVIISFLIFSGLTVALSVIYSNTAKVNVTVNEQLTVLFSPDNSTWSNEITLSDGWTNNQFIFYGKIVNNGSTLNDKELHIEITKNGGINNTDVAEFIIGDDFYTSNATSFDTSNDYDFGIPPWNQPFYVVFTTSGTYHITAKIVDGS